VIKWDLGHQIPQTDEEFIFMMTGKISAAVAGKHNDIEKQNSIGKIFEGFSSDEWLRSIVRREPVSYG
jgi:hypothetical protein